MNVYTNSTDSILVLLHWLQRPESPRNMPIPTRMVV
jgi:hypothetical protein